MVLDDVANLLSGHASEAEHSNLVHRLRIRTRLHFRYKYSSQDKLLVTNLISDVLPVVRAALLCKSFPQGCPHTDDPGYPAISPMFDSSFLGVDIPVCHSLYIPHPLLPQGRVGHHLRGESENLCEEVIMSTSAAILAP